MIQTTGERLFNIINYILLGLLALVTLGPFVHVIAQSFSSHRAIVSGEVGLWPVEFTSLAYQEVLKNMAFWQAFNISVLRTVIGTLMNAFLACLLAYPLSKAYIKGRSKIMFFIVFTMLFSGGMIPTYLIVRTVGLINSFWAYIIPGAVGAFTVIILKNFFQSVPQELEESARMDGCSNLGVLFRIYIPLSMPAIATIALFHAVAHWNSFFDAVLYMNNRSLYPLQVYLRELVILNESDMNTFDYLERRLIANESLKAATIMAATVPILIVYPFLQRYFVKGIMLGSVKG